MTILAQGTFSIKRAAKDGYSCLLSPETVVLNNDQDGNVTNYSYAKTTVTLLKGETSVAPFIGALSVSGCTAVKSGATVTIASIPQNTKQGYVDIPISYGSFSVTKRFTFQVIDYTVSRNIALSTANGALSLKADVKTVDALGNTVSQQSTSIDANAKAISLCVKSSDFESMITQHSDAINLTVKSQVQTAQSAAVATAASDAATLYVTQSAYKSELSVLNNSITSKVSQTDFDALNTVVGGHTSAITQLPNSIDARITTQVNAGGSIYKAVASSLTLSGNGISLFGKTINITGAAIFSSLSTQAQAQGYAASAQNAAVATAATDATNKVNAIQIGGTNRAFGTSTAVTAAGNNTNNQSTGLYYLDEKAFGQTVTISFKWSYTGGSSSTASLYVQLNGPLYTGLSNSINLGTAARSGNSVLTVVIPAYANDRGFYVRTDYMDGTLTITNFKIELGNKATDWSPAPEDIATHIGYRSYDDLVANAVAGKTIITNGHINTELIEASAVITKALSAGTITAVNGVIDNLKITNATVTGNITATTGKIGLFSIGSNQQLTVASLNNFMALTDSSLVLKNSGDTVFEAGPGIVAGESDSALSGPLYVCANKKNTTGVKGNACLFLSSLNATASDEVKYVNSGNHALYIPNGNICGFRLRGRRVKASQILSTMDSVIFAVASSDITLTLPSSGMEDFQPYFIRKCAAGNVTIQRGGTTDHMQAAGDFSGSSDTSVTINNASLYIIIYDQVNSVWRCSNMN